MNIINRLKKNLISLCSSIDLQPRNSELYEVNYGDSGRLKNRVIHDMRRLFNSNAQIIQEQNAVTIVSFTIELLTVNLFY